MSSVCEKHSSSLCIMHIFQSHRLFVHSLLLEILLTNYFLFQAARKNLKIRFILFWSFEQEGCNIYIYKRTWLRKALVQFSKIDCRKGNNNYLWTFSCVKQFLKIIAQINFFNYNFSVNRNFFLYGCVRENTRDFSRVFLHTTYLLPPPPLSFRAFFWVHK